MKNRQFGTRKTKNVPIHTAEMFLRCSYQLQKTSQKFCWILLNDSLTLQKFCQKGQIFNSTDPRPEESRRGSLGIFQKLFEK